MAELEKSLESLASVQEKLSRGNKDAATKAAEAAAKQLESNQATEKLLENLIASAKVDNRTNEGAEKKLADLQLNMRITADKAEATAKWQQSSAGQAVALKKELESQGKIAEENKEYSKLSFDARKADFKDRLKNSESPAARKQIKEDMRADAKKNGSRLDKIGAGISGMWASSKKVVIGGAKALLSTLAIGGLLIALGLFLQSDTFKKLSEYISGTIIPKAKELYDAFFGPKGGVGAGFSKLAEIFSPKGAFLTLLGALTIGWIGKKAIGIILSPLTLAFKVIKGTFSLLGSMLEKMGLKAAAPAKAAAAAAAKAATKAAGIKAAAAFTAAAAQRVLAKKLAAKVVKEAAEKIAKEKTARAVAAKAAAKASQKATANALKAAKAAEEAAAAALRKRTAAALTKKTADAAKAAKLAKVAAIALGKKEAAEALAKRGGSMVSKAGKTVYELTAKGLKNPQFTAMAAGQTMKAANLAKPLVNASAKMAQEVAETAVPAATKAVGTTVAKGAGKLALKLVPGVALAASGYFAWDRIKKGDYLGAGIELLSGVVASVPVIGTAGAIALQGGLIASDLLGGPTGGDNRTPKGDKIDELKKDEIARNAKAPPISGGGYTYNTDARQSSSVTTTGHSGRNSLEMNKYYSLNRGGG